MIDNLSNWFCCTNHQDAVLKSINDRRYSVFFTGQQSYQDIIRDGFGGTFFPRMYDWLREEGYALIAHWLKNYDIPDELNPATDCHRAPVTSSTEDVVALSLGSIEQEIVEAVESGRQGFLGGWINSYDLDDLMKEKRKNLMPSKVGMILSSLGYERWGRASKPIMPHMTRPSLWYKGDPSTVTYEDCHKAQGWN